MIKKNELRVGNWVKLFDGTGNAFQITTASFCRMNGFQTDVTDYIAIPLTPEVLDKLGFKKHNNAWVPLDYNEKDYNRWRFTIWNLEEGEYNYNSGEFPVPLTSLHQLQNLYFVLTQTELEYKP